jgi:hypothetical protein
MVRRTLNEPFAVSLTNVPVSAIVGEQLPGRRCVLSSHCVSDGSVCLGLLVIPAIDCSINRV